MRPKQGQQLRALRDTPVIGIITLKAPGSGDFEGVLPEGEIVIVEMDPPSHAIAVYALPKRYTEMASVLIPRRDLESPQYGSYALVIPYDSLRYDFEPVDNP